MKKTPFRVSLGFVIRARRKQKQLSQDAFADLVGLHRTYVGAVERGERNLSLASLEKISAALQCPLSILFSECEQHLGEENGCDGRPETAGS